MDVFITKLRKYLKDDPSIEIINIHGNGFQLKIKEEAVNMLKNKTFTLLCGIAVALSSPAAVLIQSDSATASFLGVFSNGNGSKANYVSFTTTDSYTNVAISAALTAFGSPDPAVYNGLLEIYLTAGIGPGTTNALEVASANINVSLPASSVANPASYVPVLLLSGLSLGPGTYYLTLAAPTTTDSFWWATNEAPAMNITTAPGITLSTTTGYAPQAFLDPYAPASGFSTQPDTVSWITVTGDLAGASVPEPSALLLTPLAWIAIRRVGLVRGRSGRDCPTTAGAPTISRAH